MSAEGGGQVKRAQASSPMLAPLIICAMAAISFALPPNARGETIPSDPLFGDQWALKNIQHPGVDIGATRAWDVSTGAPSVAVAIIDDGFDYTHPDLAPNLWINPGESGGGKESNGIDDDGNGFIDDVNGWDVLSNDNDAYPNDDDSIFRGATFSHGTNIAGMIGAKGNNGLGMTGVAWDVSLMNLRYTYSGVINRTKAIRYAGANGADVVNLSVSSTVYSREEADAIASFPNTLFVGIAANEGYNIDSRNLLYPCGHTEDNLVCVAATDQTDELPEFSNWGSRSVDLGAPGVDILGADLGGGYAGPGDSYGTSFSAAILSGAAALVYSVFPGQTGSWVKQRLIDTADSVPSLVGKTVSGRRLNVANALDVVKFPPDFTPPVTTIIASPPTLGNQANVSFTYASEADATFVCRLDSGSWASCSVDGHAYTDLDEGLHLFEVRAVDGAGNLELSSAQYPFTIDLTPPDTTITSGPSPIIHSSEAAFTYASSDANPTYECRLNQGSWISCSAGGKSLSGLGEGRHDFAVRAVDPAGNRDQNPATWQWITDVRSPTTTISGHPALLTQLVDASFSFAADENGATFKCNLDGLGWQSCQSPKHYSSLDEGVHEFSVQAIDAASTQEFDPPIFQWVVDSVPPETLITSGPPSLINRAAVGFTYSSEGNAAFECSLDGRAWEPCPVSGHPYAALGEGVHTFRVRSTDEAGNVDPTPARYQFTIDLSSPNTTITSGPSSVTHNADASFTYASDDPSATFECRLDQGAWLSCPVQGRDFNDLAEGSHSFAVRAVDQAGNTDLSPDMVNFELVAAPIAGPVFPFLPPAAAPARKQRQSRCKRGYRRQKINGKTRCKKIKKRHKGRPASIRR